MAASERGCCVPGCGKTRKDNTVLHSFPNPDKDMDRYLAWARAVGLDTSLDPHCVYRNRRVCHAHFELKFLTWTRRLSPGAFPTLLLSGEIDITDRPENVSFDAALPSTSRGVPLHRFPNPSKDQERFQAWVRKIGGEVATLEQSLVFLNRRICHKHFDPIYYSSRNRLSKIAVPSIISEPDNLNVEVPISDGSIVHPHNQLQESLVQCVTSTSEDCNVSMSTQKESALPKNVIPLAPTSSGHSELDDFSNVCRICASITDQSCPVFGEQGQCDDLAMKINKYLPIDVSPEDCLPQVVCEQCRSTLVAWHELVQCCVRADAALRQRLHNTDNTKPEETVGSTESPTPIGTPRRVSFEAYLIDRDENNDLSDHKYDTENEAWPNLSTEITSDDDDRPLAAIAKTKSNLYTDFYDALVDFRNHFVIDHDNQYACSDFSDSSDSEDANDANSERVDLNSFDDLTDCNMRKDKMDEQTRTELSQVQTKINGKVYYTCKICGKQLSSTHTYIFHKRIHTGERPCVCHICGKQFRAPNGLKRHVTETHEKQRWYTCIVCFKNFANSQNLKQHMRIHTGERPFVCPHCGKRFTQSGSLHVHLKTHSDHYPHHCAECGAKFRLRSGLTRHRLKHTGQRPHVCVHCGKGFRQKHELNSHILAHTDSKPHECTFCGTAFRQRRALRHHCKRLHQNEVRDTTQMPNVYNHVGQYEG